MKFIYFTPLPWLHLKSLAIQLWWKDAWYVGRLEGNIGQKNWCRLRRLVGLICRLEVTFCVCTCACVFLCKPSCRPVSAFYFQSRDILAGPQNFKELFYILANRNLKLMMIFQMMCNHRSTNSYTGDVGRNSKREKQFCSLWIQISHCHWLQYFSDFNYVNYVQWLIIIDL